MRGRAAASGGKAALCRAQGARAACLRRIHACRSPRAPPPCRALPQVATDTRLWLYSQVQAIRGALRELIAAAADRAEAEVDVLMPGFTHLQPAQVRGCWCCACSVCEGRRRPGRRGSGWGCAASPPARCSLPRAKRAPVCAVRMPVRAGLHDTERPCSRPCRPRPAPERRPCAGATGCCRTPPAGSATTSGWPTCCRAWARCRWCAASRGGRRPPELRRARAPLGRLPPTCGGPRTRTPGRCCLQGWGALAGTTPGCTRPQLPLSSAPSAPSRLQLAWRRGRARWRATPLAWTAAS